MGSQKSIIIPWRNRNYLNYRSFYHSGIDFLCIIFHRGVKEFTYVSDIRFYCNNKTNKTTHSGYNRVCLSLFSVEDRNVMCSLYLLSSFPRWHTRIINIRLVLSNKLIYCVMLLQIIIIYIVNQLLYSMIQKIN